MCDARIEGEKRKEKMVTDASSEERRERTKIHRDEGCAKIETALLKVTSNTEKSNHFFLHVVYL
jgi:hypothetical protein